ncbi:MAG: SRPBCC family protein [Chloroflexi bacterium]|nr:SRPBCC family protein [Chloroflexota bacterium]
MPQFRRTIDIKAPVAAVFAFHLDPSNLVRIAPQGTRSRLMSCTGIPIQVGSRVVVQSIQAGIPVQIEAEVVALDPPHVLEDRQVRGPFARWRHRHTFEEIPGGTRLTDEVDYALPMGALGGLVMGRTVERELKANFEFRQSETRRLLEE